MIHIRPWIRSWLVIREWTGTSVPGGPVIVARRWTRRGAQRAVRRDQDAGQYAPSYLYRWQVIRRTA